MTPQETIRQFVIMARNLGLNYQDALEIESKNDECLSHITGHDAISGEKIDAVVKRGIKNRIYSGWASYTMDFKTLGRPITALDICWALQEKYEGKKEFAVMTNCLTEMSIQTHRELPNKDTVWFQYAVKVIAEFNTINTTLEDWDDKVCEDIVKLIDL